MQGQVLRLPMANSDSPGDPYYPSRIGLQIDYAVLIAIYLDFVDFEFYNLIFQS